MVRTRAMKRKEMAEETCCSATPPPAPRILQDNRSQPVRGKYTCARRCIHPLNPCATTTTPVRSLPQQLNNTLGQPLVSGWKVFLEPSDKFSSESLGLQTTQAHRSEMPHENENEDEVIVNGWKVFLEPNDKRSSEYLGLQTGQRSEMPHENENEDEAQNFLNWSFAEQDQRENMTDAILPRHATSIGMTEIALNCKNSLEVDEEVESAYKSDLVTVGKYRVKQEDAPMLSKILTKYGDIGKDFEMSSASCSHFLGMVCGVCEELKNTNFTEITLLEVNEMLHKVDDCERVKLNIKWLRKELIEIKETKELVGHYNAFKENKANIEATAEVLKRKRAELSEFQREVKVKLVEMHEEVEKLTDKLTDMKADDELTNQKMLEKKEKIRAYYNTPDLVTRLL